MSFLVLVSTVSECVSISALASLIGIPIKITSSAVGLNICVITAGIKRYKLIIEKKEEKHDRMPLLAKSKVNSLNF